MSETSPTTDAAGRLHGHRRWFWIGAGAIAVLAVVTATAAPRAWASRAAASGPHGGRGGHGFAAGMMHDPAAAK